MDVMEPGNESRDLAHVEAPSTPRAEADADIAQLIHKVGAKSIAEVEKLMGELQEVKSFLQSEGERIQREMAHYMKLTQLASSSVKIIFETVSGWREAGHPISNQSRSHEFEITPSPAEDNTGRE